MLLKFSGIMAPMSSASKSPPGSRRRALLDIVLYGLCGGVLITLLKLSEYHGY
jgi:hypothetical protein